MLRGGPDEADGVQHLGDVSGELGRDGPASYGSRRGPQNEGTGPPQPTRLITAQRLPPAPLLPKTRDQPLPSGPSAAYGWEVGLLHLLQHDPQGLQVQNNVVGFLQPCTGQGQGRARHT